MKKEFRKKTVTGKMRNQEKEAVKEDQVERELTDVFCKTFLHNIAKKKYTPLRLKFFSDYCGFDRAFLSR